MRPERGAGCEPAEGGILPIRRRRGRLAIRPTLAIHDAKHRQVIRLGSAAGEDEAVGLMPVEVRAEDFGHPSPRVFQHAPRLLARLMLARRVRVSGRITAGHRFDDLRAGRRCRVVIEIDVVHGGIMGAGGLCGNGLYGVRRGHRRHPLAGRVGLHCFPPRVYGPIPPERLPEGPMHVWRHPWLGSGTARSVVAPRLHRAQRGSRLACIARRARLRLTKLRYYTDGAETARQESPIRGRDTRAVMDDPALVAL